MPLDPDAIDNMFDACASTTKLFCRFRDCQTCRWWGNQQYQRPGPFTPDDRHECQRTTSSSGNPDTPDTLAYAVDNELYGAGLITHPAFGCVMWEAKEPPHVPQ